MYKDDAVSAYFYEIIYIQVNQPKKDIKKAEIPFASIYLNHGSLLVELEHFEEANNTLKFLMS